MSAGSNTPVRTKNRFGIVVLLLLIAGVLIAVFAYFNARNNPNDWRETYDRSSRSPYGTQVFFKLLRGYFPGKPYRSVEKELWKGLDSAATRANYVFVGPSLLLDSSDLESLLHFVGRGNTALICAKSIPYELISNIYVPEDDNIPAPAWNDYAYFVDTSATLQLDHPGKMGDRYLLRYMTARGNSYYRWNFFDDQHVKAGQPGYFEPLGSIDTGFSCFVRMPYGKGTFLLHTVPLVFTNYHLVKPELLQYAGKVASYLQQGAIFWDEGNRVEESVGRRRNHSSHQLEAESPLSYILSQPALAGAWYTAIAALVLYLFFRAKRRQRIIPVLVPNTNTSLEFARMVGTLYYQQQRHDKLVEQQMQLLLSHIRERYRVSTRETGEAFFGLLAARSGVAEGHIRELFGLYEQYRRQPRVEASDLIRFYQALAVFYTKET